jgi:hypothetical protein
VNADYVHTLEKSFGNIPATLSTLCLSVTHGVSWKESAEALFAVEPFFAVLYLIFLIMVMIAFLNVFTGIVLDGVVQHRSEQRELALAQQRKETEDVCIRLLEALQAVRREEGGGNIRLEELLSAAEDAHFSKYLRALQIQSRDTWKIFHALDRDNKGEIAAQDYIDACMKLRNGRQNADIHLMLLEIQVESKRLYKEVRHDVKEVMVRVNHQMQLMLGKMLDNPLAFMRRPGNFRGPEEFPSDEHGHYVSPFSPRKSDANQVPSDTHDVPWIKPSMARPTTPRSSQPSYRHP